MASYYYLYWIYKLKVDTLRAIKRLDNNPSKPVYLPQRW